MMSDAEGYRAMLMVLGVVVLLIVAFLGLCYVLRNYDPGKERRIRNAQTEVLKGMNDQSDLNEAVERLRKEGLI